MLLAGPPRCRSARSSASQSTSSASFITSAGIVAENSSVWRPPCPGARRDDPPHVGPEAHVHHPIGLVEDQRIELVERDRAIPHVIHQPARRRHDDVHARLQGTLLLIHRHAAIDGNAGQIRVIRESLNVVFNLHRELAGRRQDQHARIAALLGRRRPRPQQPVQDREQERRGLAGAGLRAADRIVAVHDDRHDGALNRGRGRSRAAGCFRAAWARDRESRRRPGSDRIPPADACTGGAAGAVAWCGRAVLPRLAPPRDGRRRRGGP